MKVRSGFVSNSSSSSFTIVATKEITIETLRGIFGLPDEHPLSDIAENICQCILSCANRVDPEKLKDDIDKWDEEYDKKQLAIIESGKVLYTGYFSDDDGIGTEAFLCMNGLEYKSADFEMDCEGGY